MKKLFLTVAVVIMTVTSVMAQDSNDGMLVGAKLGLGSVDYTLSSSAMDVSIDQSMMSIGIFCDVIPYIRLGLDYRFSAGDAEMSGDMSGTSTESSTYLDFSVMGKYPIDLGSANLWFGAGLMYGYNLTYEYEGTDIKDDYAVSDIYLNLAAGVDIPVSSIYVCPSFTFGINMTPNPFPDAYSGVEYSGYRWELALGIATKM